MRVREKNHRLPESEYRGLKTASITACIQERRRPFAEPEIVETFISHLKDASEQFQCIVPVYCFMPDHLHLLLFGTSPQSRMKRAMDVFKELSGVWFAENRPAYHWQEDYYDHIVRHGEDLAHQARYLLENPVRGGLIDEWSAYPFSGSIGIDLAHYLHELDEGRKFGCGYQG